MFSHPVILADGIKGKLLRVGATIGSVGSVLPYLLKRCTAKRGAKQLLRNRYAHIKTKRVTGILERYWDP